MRQNQPYHCCVQYEPCTFIWITCRALENLSICFGRQQKGKPVSKQSLAHGIVDVIDLAYEAHVCPTLLEYESWALINGTYLRDI